MPSLLELQQSFLHAVRGTGEAPDCILADGLTSMGRLDVYRGSHLGNLTAALRASYPAVERLVGAEFFDAVAARFIAENAPQRPNLNDYGAGFGEFLAEFPPAAAIPYLGDVARLEWAVSHALTAPDGEMLDAAGLAELAQADEESLRFIPHPSLGLLRAAFPAEAIWRATLAQDDDALAAIKFNTGPVRLLVARAVDGVEVASLGAAEWDFAAALAGGETLADALAMAPGIDAPGALAGHLTAGHFIGFKTG